MQRPEPAKTSIATVIAASTIGCTIEWYDFFLYGVFASLVFNKLFFPTFDPIVGTLIAYTTFAVGFVARPVGGLLFGHFGDRIGRKQMLIVTLVIMGVATFAIGLLPTYAQLGPWAAVLLLLLRLAQGIGIGGEWGGAVLMATEYAPKGRRGFFGSMPQGGLCAGLFLSTAVVALLTRLPEDQFLAWGWRVAFFISAILVALGIYIRSRIAETPVFEKVLETQRVAPVPFFELLRGSSRQVLIGMGARYAEGVAFNAYAVFAISYLANTLKFPRGIVLWAVACASLVMLVCVPICGALSDRYGRRLVYGIGTVSMALVSIPAFYVMSTTKSIAAVWLAIIIPLGVVYALMYGPEASLFAELFEPRVRYSGVSFVYQFSGIFASGLTPIVLTYLLARSGTSPLLIVCYIAFTCLISLLSILAMRPDRDFHRDALPGPVPVPAA
jgi:MHS family shikimate/dehydroshikimate transporter-like MFS transporter